MSAGARNGTGEEDGLTGDSPPDPSGESLVRGMANLKVSPTGPSDQASQLKARIESNGASSSDAPPVNSSEQRYTHFLCISPDAPTNPVLYWLGRYDAATSRFLLDEAKGPDRLDLGDVLYAPNTLIDPQVRALSPDPLREGLRAVPVLTVVGELGHISWVLTSVSPQSS